MIRRVLSFLRYAFWPGRTIAFQALGGAGASGLLLGLLAAWFGSKWAGVAMFVMTFLAVVFFSAGLRLYLTIDQRPRIVLGDPYVRPIQGYQWEGRAPRTKTQHPTDFVNINVRNDIPTDGTGNELRDAYAAVRVLEQDGTSLIREFQAHSAETEDRRITLPPNSYSYGIDLVAKHFDGQWALVYNNESLRALDLAPFHIGTNRFLLEVTIIGENYRGEPKRFGVVSGGQRGRLELRH